MTDHGDKQRRRAAERLLDELDKPATGASIPSRSDDPELASMRAITTLLSEVPAEAWQPIPAPGHEPAPSKRRQRRPLTRSRALAAAVALACLAVGFAGGGLLVNRGAGPSASTRPAQAATATLRPLPGQPAGAVARVQLTSAGRIVLTFTRLPPPGTGRFYEAWLMTSATKLVSMASFRPDAHGRAQSLCELTRVCRLSR